MRFHIITIFPEMFGSYFNESIIKRALEKDRIEINIIDLRDFTSDRHKTVDDTPYGGGAGMVMKIEPLYRAIESAKHKIKSDNKLLPPTAYRLPPKTMLTSAKGRTWNQPLARECAELNDLIIICGRYEGVDERILKYVDEEISIGDYVLTGGEIPAMAIVDSVTRLLPDVLGNPDSAKDESFSVKVDPSASSGQEVESYLEYPQYTRPEIFIDNDGAEHKVPDVLLSGNHAEIEKWRNEMRKKK